MKEKINFSLGGYAFSAEEDVFKYLRNYLDEVLEALGDGPESREVLEGVEERMAELLMESSEDRAVTMAAVAKAIEMIGPPSEFTDTGGEQNEEDAPPREPLRRNRIYRDMEHRVLGGVCSGLGYALGVPPWALRILFIIGAFYYGAAVFIYIVLWISIPAARTSRERLEMKRRPIRIDSLQDEAKRFRDNLSKTSPSDVGNSFARFFGTVIWGVIRVLLFVIGIVLILASLILGFAVVTACLAIPSASAMDAIGGLIEAPMLVQFLTFFMGSWLLSMLLFVVLIIPVIALFIIGLRCLVRLPIGKYFMLTGLGVWLAACLTLGGIFFFSISRLSDSIETTTLIPAQPSDTISITMQRIYNQDIDTEQDSITGTQIHTIYYTQNPINRRSKQMQFKVSPAPGKQVALRLVRTSRGYNKSEANRSAEGIIYKPILSPNGHIVLKNHFRTEERNYSPYQNLSIELLLPLGSMVVLPNWCLTQGNYRFPYYTHQNPRLSNRSLCKMTQSGLVILDRNYDKKGLLNTEDIYYSKKYNTNRFNRIYMWHREHDEDIDERQTIDEQVNQTMKQVEEALQQAEETLREVFD